MKNIIILPFAEADIKDAAYFYEEINPKLKEHFIESLNKSLVQILHNPTAFPKAMREIRKYVMRNLPFCIFYVVRSTTIYILAVFHDSRNPRIWKSRSPNYD